MIPAYREVFAKGLRIEPTGMSFEVHRHAAALRADPARRSARLGGAGDPRGQRRVLRPAHALRRHGRLSG